MTLKTYLRSFAGGEIAPNLLGRLDLTKFQTGLQLALNFIVTPQGPVQNRPGFEYIISTKFGNKKSRLIDFTYNTTQTFALEFGDQYIRFHTNGGTLLEASKSITAITLANPAVITSAAHGFTNNQWVFLGSIGGMPRLSGRYGVVQNATANTFTVNDLFGVPISTVGFPAYTGGGTASRVYEIATPYVEADLFALEYVQSADVMTITSLNYPPKELKRLGATNWTLTNITFAPNIVAPAAPTLVPSGPGGGAPINILYQITAISNGTLEESLPSPTQTIVFDLTVPGNVVNIGMPAVPGAVRYNIYKYANGLFGFIGQSDGNTFIDNNITPDTLVSPPIDSNPFVGVNNYPQAVSYFEQRRTFGGTLNLPQTEWFTRAGTESNLTYSIPTQDDDAITVRFVARDAQTIRHLVPLGDLVAFTSGGVWRVSSASSDALSPSTIRPRQQGGDGASLVRPVLTSGSILFAPERGNHILELAYDWQTQLYAAKDVSILCPNLFDYYKVTQFAYSKAPFPILWAIRNDGILLGMTYVPEHEVEAWSHHNTQGRFESITSVSEGDEDGVYAIVSRQINGQAVRYIERMHSRQMPTQSDAFFVDAGATYAGTSVSFIDTGLWHLEGQTVSILEDGGVAPPQVVINGRIDLDGSAEKVNIGLSYNSDFQTMPSIFELQALGQGQPKNVNKTWIRVQDSSSIKVGPSLNKLRSYAQRSTEPMGSPPNLVNGVIEVVLDPKWQEDGSICIRQSDPLPLTVLSMTLEVATGG